MIPGAATGSAATARRDLGELETAIRLADRLLRASREMAWSGPAAEGYRAALADLESRVHRAALGMDEARAAMLRHLWAVEDAHRQTALALRAAAGPAPWPPGGSGW